MADLIKLLPDAVANQIAAGEVIQRPASALKEILENAIDSGATVIKAVIKDAGKTLIQLTDNGCGMSETDARMCFEKHATSKIHTAGDLFSIQTMGFRGEALPSIAAIAQVELKTRRADDELGTRIEIEGSKLLDQATVSCPAGTTIAIKNLFYNVPARRKFLKSPTVELRHLTEEFQRIALVKPEIAFTLMHNDKVVYQIPSSSLKQRIANIMGAHYGERIVPVEQTTEKVSITGFIGKPQYARKTRGEQYFFANKRFIKHPYLHHAVDNSFSELLPNDTFPSYFIYIQVPPDQIDINIHPTKTEVNFQDNQLIYAVLRSAIKQSLGKYNITPTLDFDVEASVNFDEKPNRPLKNPFQAIETSYNPFEIQGHTLSHKEKKNQNWEQLYEITRQSQTGNAPGKQDTETGEPTGDGPLFVPSRNFFQLHNKYIITSIKSGLIIIDQHNAHLRILYEKFLKLLENRKTVTQKELFPQHISLNAENAEVLKELMGELVLLGFSIKKFGKNTFVVDGTPADCENTNVTLLIEGIIENYKNQLQDITIDKKIRLARSLAANLAIKSGKKLQPEEIEMLSERLFSCSMPEKTPDGRDTLFVFPFNDLEKKFN